MLPHDRAPDAFGYGWIDSVSKGDVSANVQPRRNPMIGSVNSGSGYLIPKTSEQKS